MSDSETVQATAGQLLAQYGEDAEVIATLRAAEAAAQGDVAALQHWDDVIAWLSEAPPPGDAN